MRGLLLAVALVLLVPGSNIHATDDTAVQISPEMERLIDRALKYLSDRQNPDGSWDAADHGKNVGIVALATMSFMAKGNLPGEGPYGHVVAKGTQWIINQAKPNGLIQFTGQSKQAAVMYGHALATLMLSEVWGQTRRKDVGRVLRKAVDLILACQGPDGSWNYKSDASGRGDTSVVVMQMMALKSASEAGIYIPEGTITKAINLIKGRYNAQKKQYAYQVAAQVDNKYGAAAAGVTIMHICHIGAKNKAEKKKYRTDPTEQLLKIFKGFKQKQYQSHIFYFIYYGTVCSYQAGTKHYLAWLKELEPFLKSKQKPDGRFDYKHGIVDTAFAVLSASLPYRYLPVYQN